MGTLYVPILYTYGVPVGKLVHEQYLTQRGAESVKWRLRSNMSGVV